MARRIHPACGWSKFDDEQQIPPIFDHLQAPDAGGLFLGDYQGLSTCDDRFRAMFGTANSGQPGNRTDVHYGQFRSIEADHAAARPVRFGVGLRPDRYAGTLRAADDTMLSPAVTRRTSARPR